MKTFEELEKVAAELATSAKESNYPILIMMKKEDKILFVSGNLSPHDAYGFIGELTYLATDIRRQQQRLEENKVE